LSHGTRAATAPLQGGSALATRKDIVHASPLWPIVRERRGPGAAKEPDMSHQPPKEHKKKAQHTAKEKKAIKQQKKQAGQVVPFIKH
jgi:hypothetical protein